VEVIAMEEGIVSNVPANKNLV